MTTNVRNKHGQNVLKPRVFASKIELPIEFVIKIELPKVFVIKIELDTDKSIVKGVAQNDLKHYFDNLTYSA